MSVRVIRALALMVLCAIARGFFVPALEIPSVITMIAALVALLLPGVWIAQALRAGDGRPAGSIAWGFAFSLALVTFGSISFHLSGTLGLEALLAFVIACGFGTALLAPPPGRRALALRAETWLLVASVAVVALVSSPRVGYLTDAYDHLGTVRWMTLENHAYPVEAFHVDRAEAGLLDPRKGTYHTTFALASELTGVDPVDGYVAFWLVTLLVAFASILTVARTFLRTPRAAWIAFILFVVLHRGGPAGEWFSNAGYPGSAGLWLYLLFLSGIVRPPVRGGGNDESPSTRTRPLVLALLGVATVGVHLFYGLLAALAVLYLVTGLLIARRGKGSGAVLTGAAAFGLGALPIALFRYLRTYDPANLIHLHRQAVIELTDRLAVLDYVPVLQALGIGGLLAVFFLPFLDWRGREAGTTGELFLGTSLAGTFLIVWNPIVFPLLEPHLGYLMRRIPYAVPWAFVFATVIARAASRARPVLPADRGSRASSSRTRAITYASLAAVALTAGWDATRTRAPRARAASGVEEIARRVAADVAEQVPARGTVLTDPVTGYVLFGRTALRPVAIPDQHSSPNDPGAARRLALSQRALHPETSEAEFLRIAHELRATEVLLVTGYPRSFQTYNTYYSPGLAARTDSIFDARPGLEAFWRSENAVLYGPLRSELPASGRHERPWAGGGRFERPGGAAALPGGVTLTGSRLGASEGRPGDLVWLETDWTLPHADAGPVPMLLYTRGVRLDGPGGDRDRPPGRPWKIFSLGGREFPYLLWRRGESVAWDAPLRIPARVGPGRYEIQVTTDLHPFFAVRRLGTEGGRWGAAREGWTAVDTLEVLP